MNEKFLIFQQATRILHKNEKKLGRGNILWNVGQGFVRNREVISGGMHLSCGIGAGICGFSQTFVPFG